METFSKLVNLKLYSEETTMYKGNLRMSIPEYFLSAIYEYGVVNDIYECIFPKIHLPMTLDKFPIANSATKPNNEWFSDTNTINLGFGDLPLCKNKTGYEFICKHKVREMTLSEIEKKLGYKIKIVED